MNGKMKKLKLAALLGSITIAFAGFGFANVTPLAGGFVAGNSIVAAAQVTGLSGEGTQTSPYVVSNLDELKWFRDDVNAGNTYQGKYVQLTADIDLNNEEWTPIGTSSNTFNGYFDGANYKIYNLTINWSKSYVSGGTNDNYVGLFGYMKGGNTAAIKNITVENANVTGCLYVGVILGRSYTGGIIENCHVTGSVKVDGYSYIGGVVGRHDYSKGLNVNGDQMAIYNCSVKATTSNQGTISGDYAVTYVGGIVGFMGEGNYVIDTCSVENISVSGVYGVGGVSGIGHYGNTISGATVDTVTVTSTNNDPESNRTNNVGLIAGAVQGTESSPTVITGNTLTNTSGSVSYNDETTKPITNSYGNSMTGSAPVTNLVAMIGDVEYETLTAALAAAKTQTGNVTIELYAKVTLSENLSGSWDSITFVGKEGDAEIYLDKQGFITAQGKDVIFEDLTLSKSAGGFINDAGFMNVAFGVHRVDSVTYTNCYFANGSYASSGVVTYTDCEFKRSHDKYGLWAYGNVDVTVSESTFSDYRGIKMYAEGAAKTVNLTVENTDFSAVDGKPAIVLTYGESVTLNNNTYSSTGVFELDKDGAPNGTPVTSDVSVTCVNDDGDCGVLVDGKIYTTVAQAAAVATSGSTVTLLHNSTETVEFADGVNFDKNGYTADNVTVMIPVARVNGVGFKTLTEALKALTSGATLELVSDITISEAWDCRYNGAKITVPVTINGNNHTLKLTGVINDNNWNTVFRFEADATVKNLTIDVSEATKVQRGISSKLSITVENCKFIGNDGSAKRAIIFGEGAQSAIAGVTATIADCEFEGWSYGVSDNQSGKDAKAVTITGSTFTNASALISAAENVTFTNNELDGGYVNISSYTAADTVKVVATGNTLDSDYAPYNKINTKFENITADEDFVTLSVSVNGICYTTLQEAINKANGAEITLLGNTKGAGVVIDKIVNINFNGFTYTVTSGVEVDEVSYGFYIKPATATSGDTIELTNGAIAVAANADIDIVVLSAAPVEASVLITDVSIAAENATAILANSSMTEMRGACNISSKGTAILVNNANEDNRVQFIVTKFGDNVPEVSGNFEVKGKNIVAQIIDGVFYGNVRRNNADNLWISGGKYKKDGIADYLVEGKAIVKQGKYFVVVNAQPDNGDEGDFGYGFDDLAGIIGGLIGAGDIIGSQGNAGAKTSEGIGAAGVVAIVAGSLAVVIAAGVCVLWILEKKEIFKVSVFIEKLSEKLKETLKK